jgi:hypothetical protein
MASPAAPIRNGHDGQAPVGDVRVRGWKDIGRWFGVDERTVKRWEAARGLPIRRVPGEPRAPVFAYEAELTAWLQSGGAREGEAAPLPVAPAAPVTQGRLPLALAIAALVAAVGWFSWQATDQHREALNRGDDVRRLAQSQLSVLGDRLERQPGTVALRAELARDAAAALSRIAAQADAAPQVKREAAEAYRRLARVQSSTDRPSLRDRKAARATLATALGLIEGDASAAAGETRAMILIDAARHAAADGALSEAPAMLAAAAEAAPVPAPALRAELLLAQSEIAQWQGDYATAIARADAVAALAPADAAGWRRHIRAQDLAAEARFYAGDRAGAVAGYRRALAASQTAAAQFPGAIAFQWADLRQRWTLGSTLVDIGGGGGGGDGASAAQRAEALTLLAQSRDGWMALARADPQDASLAAWVRTTRLSYGEALNAAGQSEAAIAELSASLAERRALLALHPEVTEAQRGLVVGLNAFADALGSAGRVGEACGLLAEADAMAAGMASRGTLTGLDRTWLLRLLRESRGRFCGNRLTLPAKSL